MRRILRYSALFCFRLKRRRFCAASIPAIFGACLPAEEIGGGVRRVWAGPDTNLPGSPSLDGRFLSFVDSGSGDLVIRDLASGEKRRLTSSGP